MFERILTLNLDPEPVCSPMILDALKNRRVVRLDRLRTTADLRLTQLGWIYDLNFQATLDLVKERRIIERLAAGLPPDPAAQALCEQLHSHHAGH